MFKYSIHEKINLKSNCGPKSKIKAIKNKYSEYLNEHSLQYPKTDLFIRDVSAKMIYYLPIGQYKLTDRINNYTLVKYAHDGGDTYLICNIYVGNPGIMSNKVAFFADKEDVFEDGSKEQRRYDNPQMPTLSMLTSVGGMSIHSKDYYSCLSNLQLVQRGSFKQYTSKEI